MDVWQKNPYVGPRPFEERDSHLFFGREREARDLLSLVIAEPVTLFFAPSGAGKSSLLNARLIPDLRREGFFVLPPGRVSGDLPAGISRVDNIFTFNLLLSLDQGRSNVQSLAAQTLSDYLHAHRQAHQPPPSASGADRQARVLIIDQFEEIVTTQLGHWHERQPFFAQLNQAVKDDPWLWVILAMREDYVASLEPYARSLPGRLRARFHMQRMTVESALEAIEKPAQENQRPFAPGVAAVLAENLQQIRIPGEEKTRPGEFVEPVQLQVVCYQLWENLKNRPPGEITHRDLDQLGDVDAALAQYYEQSLARVLPHITEPEIDVRNWFEHELITEAGTRGIVYQGPEKTAGLSNAAVQKLAECYLLRAAIRAGGTWYELVHDRFIPPILQANQLWRIKQPLLQIAQLWADADRDPTRLLTGQQLQAALETRWQGLGPLVEEFIQASQQAEDARQAERQAAEEALRQKELEAARQLAAAAEAQRQAEARQAREAEARAREQVEAAAQLRKRAIWLLSMGTAALILALTAGFFGWQSQQNAERANAESTKAIANALTAESASTLAVANEATAIAERATAVFSKEVAEKALTDLKANLEAQVQQAQMAYVPADATSTPLPTPTAIGAPTAIATPTPPPITELPPGALTLDELIAQLAQVEIQQAVIASTDSELLIDGQVVSWAGAEGDFLLKDPFDETSGMVWLPVGTPVTVLRWGQGSESYGSGQWYEVEVANPDNPSDMLTGWLPVEVVGQVMPPVQQVDVATVVVVQPDPTATPTPTPLPTDMVRVPAGKFLMGSLRDSRGLPGIDRDPEVDKDELPQRTVVLPEFWIDRTEVSNADYRRCVAAGVCRAQTDGDFNYHRNPAFDDYPVVFVSWQDAATYCKWQGKRLPTEAEWEKAARGVDGRIWPWGNALDDTPLTPVERANVIESKLDKPQPVDAYSNGASPYGALNMVGNVWEWTADWYRFTYYAERPDPDKSPPGPDKDDSTGQKVIRGGGFRNGGVDARTADRNAVEPVGAFDIGFRCVR